MISVLQLLWIIPVCIMIGMFSIGFFVAANKSNRESKIYEEGIQEGLRIAKVRPRTLQSYIETSFNGDIESFMKEIDGVIYGVESDGQLTMMFIDSGVDLLKYKSYEVLSISGDVGSRRPMIRIYDI